MSVVIKERKVGNVAILDIAGRVTLFFADDLDNEDPNCGTAMFRDAIRQLVARGERSILLNLGEVSYIDSSGIGELINGFTIVTNNGGQLKLLNLTKRVKDLLQITKLYTIFDVHESEAGAVRSFA